MYSTRFDYRSADGEFFLSLKANCGDFSDSHKTVLLFKEKKAKKSSQKNEEAEEEEINTKEKPKLKIY